MHAVDGLSDAIDVTREFLTPVRARTWLKLAVVVLFLTGIGVGMPTVPTGDLTVEEEDPFTGEEIENPLPTDDLQLLVFALAATAIGIWLVFALVGSLMEFVLVGSLRSGEVRVRRYASEHRGRALSLFAFRLLLALVGASLVGLVTYLTLGTTIPSFDDLSVSVLGGVIAASGLLYLVYALTMRLTTEFVVPVMLLEERGIRSGWARFWPTLRGNLGEYAVYVVLATIVSIVASIAVSILAFLTILVLLIPFVLLAVVAVFLGPLAIPLLVVLVLALIVTFLLVFALYEMPVVVYIRYYALLVLGDTEQSLDLIPDRRERLRSRSDLAAGDDQWSTDDTAAGWTDRRSGDERSGVNDETEDDGGWSDETARDAWRDETDGRQNDRQTGEEGGDRTTDDDDSNDDPDGWRYKGE